MEQQKDVRPYTDAEVPAAIERLLSDREFLDFLGRYHSPRIARLFPRVVRYMAKRRLQGLLGGVSNIAEFQHIVAMYARKIIDETMTSFTYIGIERLRPNTAYLFVSNHRDIAGDSMLVDYALYDTGRSTVRIAVGDNLVQRAFATEVMKLNKSFFIKRSEEGAKKIYAALLESSNYIHESLAEGESIWIAQAEGRAKNGLDLTDPAIIKMFALAARKEPFGELIDRLNIIPVALSYEFDPCDVLKAKELHAQASQGAYVKPPGEDLLSLVRGLGGFKGRVTVSFGHRLNESFETPEAVAEEIDRQILSNLVLYPANFLALRTLAEKGASEEIQSAWQKAGPILGDISDPRFDERLEACPEEWRDEMLAMYANPLLNKLRHGLEISLPG